MQNKQCALCHNHKDKLQRSHIIPRFVIKWVKKNSHTDYLRFSGNPKLRVQDGLKNSMLCLDCEELLNLYETKFANNIFHAFSDNWRDIKCEDWLLKFAVSISWRSLIYLHTLNEINGNLLCREAEEVWRHFLLDKINDIGLFDQHLITFKIPNNVCPVDEGDEFREYILKRTIGSQVVYSSYGDLFICTKMAFFLIIGIIENKDSESFFNTKIEPNNYIRNTSQTFPEVILRLCDNITYTIHDDLYLIL